MKEEEQRRNAISDISRAARATDLLTNDLYLEAITVMNAAMYTEFESTKLEDTHQRHELWQRMQLMKQFVGRFESIVKHGAKGEKTLNLLEKSLKAVNLR